MASSPEEVLFEMVAKSVAAKFELYDARFDAWEARADLKLASLKDGKEGAPGPKGDKGDPGKDGVITEKVVAFRGIWKEGETYTPGDIVGSSGSGWMCNAETKDKPGTSEAWTLFIKRGRDGRDGKDGEPVKWTREEVIELIRDVVIEQLKKDAVH